MLKGPEDLPVVVTFFEISHPPRPLSRLAAQEFTPTMELRFRTFFAVCFAAVGALAETAPELGTVLAGNKELSTFYGLLKVIAHNIIQGGAGDMGAMCEANT